MGERAIHYRVSRRHPDAGRGTALLVFYFALIIAIWGRAVNGELPHFGGQRTLPVGLASSYLPRGEHHAFTYLYWSRGEHHSFANLSVLTRRRGVC